MDDVWDDQGADPTELTRVEREHGNAGYLAGITQSKSQGHQPGFDEGYRDGAEIGLQAGNIIGTFQALGLADMEAKALKALAPQELFNGQYFDEQARPLYKGDHPLIVEWRERAQQFA